MTPAWQLSQPGVEDRVAIRRRLLGNLLEQAPDAMANLNGAQQAVDRVERLDGVVAHRADGVSCFAVAYASTAARTDG